MGMMFRLTDAGRRVRFDVHTKEMKAILTAMRTHGTLSFDDIVRHAPGEMFGVLQAMATAMASGLLTSWPTDAEAPDKDGGIGHGHW